MAKNYLLTPMTDKQTVRGLFEQFKLCCDTNFALIFISNTFLPSLSKAAITL